MARYERSDSHTVFAPTTLRLKSVQHPASLEKNEVAVLSGRDPKKYGEVARLAGGEHIRRGSNNPSGLVNIDSFIHRSRFFARRGLRAGHMLLTKTTADFSTNGGTPVALPVVSTIGFEVDDLLAIYNRTEGDCAIVIVTEITSLVSMLAKEVSGAITAATKSGSTVVRTSTVKPGGTSISGTSITSFKLVSDLRVGHTCNIIVNGMLFSVIEDLTVQKLFTDEVHFTASVTSSYPSAAGNDVAIIPKIELYETHEVLASFEKGGITVIDSSDTIAFHGNDEADATAERDFAMYDQSIIMVDGQNRPAKFGSDEVFQNAGFSATGDTVTDFFHRGEYVGLPELPQGDATDIFDIKTVGGAGPITQGEHRIFARLVDYSVFPPTKSGPIGEQILDMLTQNDDFQFLSSNFWNTIITNTEPFERALTRATHLEIWMTPIDSLSYFRVYNKHVCHLHDGIGGFKTITFALLDSELVLNDPLGDNDFVKGLMPLGRYIHFYQGVMFIAGETRGENETEYPSVVSGNLVWFSRTDKSEPENFPPDNVEQVGTIGDHVRGFTEAGDVMIILNRYSFTIVQRAGTFLLFKGAGALGQGMAYDEAYVSLGTHAAWVGDESIWLFDGRTQDHPVDIGFDIRDWIRDLKRENAEAKIRMGYDPINRLLYVSKVYVPDSVYEVKMFSFDERTWQTVESFPVDSFVHAEKMDSSTSPWLLHRLVWPRITSARIILFSCYDPTQTNTMVQGGYSPVDLSGTVVSGGSLSTLLDDTHLGTDPAPWISGALEGSIFKQIETDGTETDRIIRNSSSSQIIVDRSITLVVGAKWIIAPIPYRVRFPPIRGEDPFAVKIVRGFQAMFDNIDDGGTGISANLTVDLYRNYLDTVATGGTGTIALSVAASKIDRDRAVDVQATGKIIEVQINQVDAHIDFSLVYCALPVRIVGPISEDRSTTV